jgi:hypothetical protein
MPLWRAIGKSKFLVQARTLPKTVLVVVGVVALLICLFVVPADFDLPAEGTLEPVGRQDVYAHADGDVEEFGVDTEGKPIEQGAWVKKDQMLLRLRNVKLEREKADIEGQIITERATYDKWEHEEAASGARMKPDEHARLMGQLTESKEKLDSLENQKTVFQAQIDDLTVKSPIDGQVVTSDLKKHLDKRPVKRGDFLLRVADTKGPWELELHMTDDRMGHIDRQENLQHGTKNPDLVVNYRVDTAPGSQHKGTIDKLPLDVNPEKEKGNVALIRVKIDKNEIEQADRVAGASVSGKVHCGRRSLGYVWFHDLFAFIQMKIFFRFF